MWEHIISFLSIHIFFVLSEVGLSLSLLLCEADCVYSEVISTSQWMTTGLTPLLTAAYIHCGFTADPQACLLAPVMSMLLGYSQDMLEYTRQGWKGLFLKRSRWPHDLSDRHSHTNVIFWGENRRTEKTFLCFYFICSFIFWIFLVVATVNSKKSYFSLVIPEHVVHER